jgi:hypothetical protein
LPARKAGCRNRASVGAAAILSASIVEPEGEQSADANAAIVHDLTL